MSQIQDLRDKLFRVKHEIEACEKSMVNARQDAQRLLADGDIEGLMAVNDRYLSLQQQRQDRQSDLKLIALHMEQHYQAVADADGIEAIDFSLSLEPWEEGWVVVIDRCLVEEECKAIQTVCGLPNLYTEAAIPGIRLTSDYYADRRDTRKSHRPGQWLWEKLAPILPKQGSFNLEITKLAVLN
jgi:hypothetical protein